VNIYFPDPDHTEVVMQCVWVERGCPGWHFDTKIQAGGRRRAPADEFKLAAAGPISAATIVAPSAEADFVASFGRQWPRSTSHCRSGLAAGRGV
jgi:hypothetical protein